MAISESTETDSGKHGLGTARTMEDGDPDCLRRLQILVGELLVKNELLRHQLRCNEHICAKLQQVPPDSVFDFRYHPGLPGAHKPDSFDKAFPGEIIVPTTNALSLFSPVQLGALSLKHRVVMAPLTRSRSVQPDSVPGDLMKTYYEQRASDGGFIITEATNISLTSRGWLGAPGLYSQQQVEGWKRIVAAVHAKGGHFFAQLWHTGRSSHTAMTGGEMPVSASVDPAYWLNTDHVVSIPGGWAAPSPHRALTVDQIAVVVADYRRAAERAVDAGFEGVELHAANGYLVDQFLQDGSNQRTDEYGGSIENRTRFLLEVVGALVSVWGAGRVAVRLAPGGTWNGMSDSNPQALFSYAVKQLNQFDLAYLHLIEPRVKGSEVVRESEGAVAAEHFRTIFHGKLIAAGGFEPETAEEALEKGTADAVAFGRHFVANPDLPRRIREGLPLNRYDRSTFYTFDARGYTDYPFFGAASEV